MTDQPKSTFREFCDVVLQLSYVVLFLLAIGLGVAALFLPIVLLAKLV